MVNAQIAVRCRLAHELRGDRARSIAGLGFADLSPVMWLACSTVGGSCRAHRRVAPARAVRPSGRRTAAQAAASSSC